MRKFSANLKTFVLQMLRATLTEMRFFDEYIMLSSAIRMSFQRYRQTPVEELFVTLEKRVSSKKISRSVFIAESVGISALRSLRVYFIFASRLACDLEK